MDSLNDIAQQLMRFSPDVLLVVDESAHIRFANESVRELLGYEPEELLGQPLEMLVPERLRSHHKQHVSGFLQHPRTREMGVRVPDLCARRRDGSEFPASIRLAPFRTRNATYIAAAVRDNTERTQINEALVAAREEADRANRAKSRFLATASHDLRQPLQTIRLLNAAMLKIAPRAELKELLLQQNQAIESTTRLLNALLDISRLESGAIQVHLTDVPLASLFDELRNEFASVARARGLTLRLEAAAALLTTDHTLFYQLLQNVVGNALKYTDQGVVSVTCGRGDDALTITVEDTGIGIPADKIERIFDEYYQVGTHGAKRMGVGLGLAIVKEVANLLGYTVVISSRIGAGTQVCISVPLRCVKPASAAAPKARPQVAATSQCKARLLLIEDHESVRVATELFLKFEGFEVLSAGSDADADALLKDLQRSDIVVADYYLDGQRTGLDVLLELRARVGWETPGVILSGDLPSVLRSLKAPVESCCFLGKPVDTTALLEAIAGLFEQSRRQQSAAAEASAAQTL